MNKMLSVAIAISVAIVIIAVSISDPTTDVQPNEPTSKYVEQVSDRNKQEPLTINPHYCGSGEANSNKYITEYVLPNNCSLPIGIAIDEYGKVWIGESNERKLAVFDPDNESLQEFDIPGNTEDAKGSGIWSIIFGEDKSVWFSDVSTNSIWMFQIEEQKFLKYEIPTPESFPFDLTIDEDEKIWFTELFGKKFGYIDPVTNQIIELEPPLQPSTIGAITVDENNNIWLVMNNPTGSFVLKYEQESEIYSSYKLPDEVTAPVGISIDKSGNVWIADHAGSMFFKINPLNNITKAYVTSLPPVRTSINTGGLPSSYPYWIVIDTNDRIWINEHQGNAIAVFDPNEETLIEYFIPTQNPNWGSCEGYDEPCGIANPLRFAIAPDGRVWFTEWSESKIGVLDPSELAPIIIEPNNRTLIVEKGKTISTTIDIIKNDISTSDLNISLSGTFTPSGELFRINAPMDIESNFNRKQVTLKLNPSKYIDSGTYTLMVSASYEDIVVSKAIEVIIIEPKHISRSWVSSENFASFVNGDGWVMLENDQLKPDDIIKINGGFLSNYDLTKPINLVVKSSDGSEYELSSFPLNQDGTFSTSFQLNDVELFGIYEIDVSYLQETVTLSFNVINPLDEQEKSFSFERISYNPAFYCAKYDLVDFVESGETINKLVNEDRIEIIIEPEEEMEYMDDRKLIKVHTRPVDEDSDLGIAVTHSVITIHKNGSKIWSSGLLHSHCGAIDFIMVSKDILLKDPLEFKDTVKIRLDMTQHFLQNVRLQSYTGPIIEEQGEYNVEIKLVWIELRPIKPVLETFNFVII